MSDAIDNWNPDDKLGRKASADFLTSFLMKRFQSSCDSGKSDTFVLNIRAEWGFGKTFFLERWSKDLKQNFPVVYFDAWKNDYSDDPLIGFIAEMNESLSGYFKKAPIAERYLEQTISVGRRLIKPIGIGVAAALAKQLSGLSIDQLQKYFSEQRSGEDVAEELDGRDSKDEVSSLISKCADIALQEHLDTKETIELFKKRLGRLIDALNKEPGIQLPMFIFVDELDRCRPTYAIELLESIKHLFGVPGVYFIIATNLDQLGHSIKAVYGEQFDAERYLKRFFDQEYLLPLPNNERFTEYLFSRYSLNGKGPMVAIIENEYPEPPEQSLFTTLCNAFKLGLRDREQIAGSLQAVLLNWPKGESIHLAYLLFLIIAKHISSSLFQQLAEGQLRDLTTFAQAINLPDNAVFKCKTLRHDPEWGRNMPVVEEVKVHQLLWFYHTHSKYTCKELWKKDFNSMMFPDKIGYALAQDCPRNYSSSETPVPPINQYASRVAQAGQLFLMN